MNFQNFCSFTTKVDLRKISDVHERNCNYFYQDAVKMEIYGNIVVKIQIREIIHKKKIKILLCASVA